jgi:hypothetical protein
MFEFKRFAFVALGPLARRGVADLEKLGREGWQIKAAIRGVTGNEEIIYLERTIGK